MTVSNDSQSVVIDFWEFLEPIFFTKSRFFEIQEKATIIGIIH